MTAIGWSYVVLAPVMACVVLWAFYRFNKQDWQILHWDHRRPIPRKRWTCPAGHPKFHTLTMKFGAGVIYMPMCKEMWEQSQRIAHPTTGGMAFTLMQCSPDALMRYFGGSVDRHHPIV